MVWGEFSSFHSTGLLVVELLQAHDGPAQHQWSTEEMDDSLSKGFHLRMRICFNE